MVAIASIDLDVFTFQYQGFSVGQLPQTTSKARERAAVPRSQPSGRRWPPATEEIGGPDVGTVVDCEWDVTHML